MLYDNRIKEIDELKKSIDKHRPFEKGTLDKLKEYYRISLTYSSNALEGNSLTETETKIVLEDGITIGGKPLRDHYEAMGHSEAYDLLYLLSKTTAITEKDILELHRLFYYRIDQNKQAFQFATAEELPELTARSSKDSAMQIYRIIKAIIKDVRQLTDDQEEYLKKVMTRLQEGAIPKQTAKTTMQNLNKLKDNLQNPLKVIATLQTSIPSKVLEEHIAANVRARTGIREVILSEYLSSNPG